MALSIFVSSNGFSIAFLFASTALFLMHHQYPINISRFLQYNSYICKVYIDISWFVIKSEIHLYLNIVFYLSSKCLFKVIFCKLHWILSFGITIRVSTAFLSLLIIPLLVFLFCKTKWFYITHIVKIPISFAIFAITGHAHVHIHHHS